jgi:hypothetical protein
MMMKTIKLIIWFITLVAIPRVEIPAQSLDVSGFVDSYHAVRLNAPHDFMSSRSRLRVEMRGHSGNSSIFASVNANHNYLLPSRTFIELRESYFDYTGGNWDLRAGRQIIIWGVSDGLRITDLVSPLDMTEFLARDYDDIRIPVDAIRWRYLNDFLKFEAIFVPVFQSFIIPDDPANPWSVTYPSEGPHISVMPAWGPERNIRNSEFGGRLSMYFSGFDVSVAGLYTWNKLPVYERNFSSGHDTLYLVPKHFRYSMLGMDFSRPQGAFVIRGEAAIYAGEPLSRDLLNQRNAPVRKNTFNYLVGLDWYPGGEWTLTGQYSHKLILLHEEELEDPQNTLLATLGVSKKVLRSTLGISAFGYVDLTNGGLFSRKSLDYSLSDQIHLLAGIDLFHGDEGIFGAYNKNSEIWIKARYNF